MRSQGGGRASHRGAASRDAPARRLGTGSRAATVALALAGAVLALAAIGLAPAVAKKRIVALTPFAANTLAKLGAKPVAVGETPGNVRLDRRLRGVRRLPLSHASNGPNLEQLAELRPDLVLSERTWRAGHGAVRDLGMRVVERDPARVGGVRRKIKAIGRTVGRRKRARRLARRTGRRLRRATRGIESRPRVLMVLGVGQTPYAFLPNSWGGNLVERAGGTLLTDDLVADGEDLLVSGGFAQLSNEEILVRNPDVIIAVPHGRGDDLPAIADSLRENPYFAQTNAGQNGRLHVTTRNTLLQAGTDVAATIKLVRKRYLRNR